jgi:tetratricopeptide (TPR) repeat protein
MASKLLNRTGSPALGAELRRLRGTRTLSEIASLTRAPIVAGRITPLTATAIAQVEGGAVMPTVEALHALALVYRISPQRLYDFVATERESKDVSLPGDLDETLASYNDALREGRWHDAIALALHGESLGTQDVEKTVWRARRGSVLAYTGRQDEAILVLTECLNSSHLGRHRRFQILRNLADVHAMAGYSHSAVECARQALLLCPQDVSDSTRAAVMASLISALLTRQSTAELPDAEEVSEALDLIARARLLRMEPDPHWDLFLDLQQALSVRFEGDLLAAARQFASIARRASQAREERLRLVALLNLGVLRREQGRLVQAERHLLRALASALHLRQVTETFEIYVELLLIARETGNAQQSHYLQRCQHYYPLVRARTPGVMRFEQVDRGEAR